MNKMKAFFSWKGFINLYICRAILAGILVLLADFPAAIAPLAFIAVLPIA